MDFNWTVGDSTLGSDHMPIFIKTVSPYESPNLLTGSLEKLTGNNFKVCVMLTYS